MHRITTMHFGACVGYTGTPATHRISIGNNDYNRINKHIGKTFFDGNNYRWILQCLDGGYEISTDLTEYMQDYSDLLKDFIDRLTSYSKKWRSKLKHQSSLSSYHTTKRAQRETIRSPEKLAQLIQSRHDAIQQVITTYKKQVEKMYPSELLGTIHRHYRTETMKTLFKTAQSPLNKISAELEKLREKEKKAQEVLQNAKTQCQNLSLVESTSKNKLTRAHDQQETKERELQYIQRKLARIEDEYDQERELYREKATQIYEQCRALEQERLNQIQQTLVKLIEAVHSSEYSKEQDAIYEQLLFNINSQQNSVEDLDFWRRTYRVNGLTRSISSEMNQNGDEDGNTESHTTIQIVENPDQNATIEANTNQLVIEDQEEQSVADKITTSATTKLKKKKKSTVDPTTSDAT